MARLLILASLTIIAATVVPVLGDWQDETALTVEQAHLVDSALARYHEQGLELPEIAFVFHDELWPCHGHLGLYRKGTMTLEMCSLDRTTMLHELAHAWANENLDESFREEFVAARGLDSWNDHQHEWERRGTEHVAETIAWALSEESQHVEWLETLPDGSTETTARLLSLGVEVDTLFMNFIDITGMEPVFRKAEEWTVSDDRQELDSPELRRVSG